MPPRLIHHSPEQPFVDFLCETLERYPTRKKHTRVFLPAGDVCRFSREALTDRNDVFIYSLEEATNLFGKGAPCRLYADLPSACGRFLVGAFLEKAGILSGEKAAPRFYKLLCEAERLYGDPALLAEAAEQENITADSGKGAELFLLLCRHWQDVTRDAGYLSASAKRALRVSHWLEHRPPSSETDRIIAAYMPIADASVSALCRYTCQTEDGIVMTQTTHVTDMTTLSADHPQHYIREAQRMLNTCDHLSENEHTHTAIAPYWFAPAKDIPDIAEISQQWKPYLPDAHRYADIFTENEANAERLRVAAHSGETSAFVTNDAGAALHIAASLRKTHTPFLSVFDISPDMSRFHTCIDACFLYARARGRTMDTALHVLTVTPFSINTDSIISVNTHLTRRLIHATLYETGANPIVDISGIIHSPMWPDSDYPEISAYWQTLHEALTPLRQAALKGSAPAFEWYDAFISASMVCGIPIYTTEEGHTLPTLQDALAFLKKEGLSLIKLSPERALSLIKEAIGICFPQPEMALHPGIPLICRSEHIRLLAPDLVIFSGLTEDGFDRSDTDAYLGKLPESAALIGAEARIARRSIELLSGLAACRTIYSCAASRDGKETRPSRAMARLLLLHRIAGNCSEPYLLPITPVAKDSPPDTRISCLVKERVKQMHHYATGLETAFQNPYIFYAKHILRLKEPRRHLEDSALSAEFGTILHEAADAFYRRFSHACALDRKEVFLSCLRLAVDHRRLRIGEAAARAFMAKGVALCESFLLDDAEERMSYTAFYTEQHFQTMLSPDDNTTLMIRARADRIGLNDHTNVTHVGITDIKTGALPSPSDIVNGKRAQLAVESYLLSVTYPHANIHIRAVKYLNEGLLEIKKPKNADLVSLPASAESALKALFTHILSADAEACVFPFTREIRYKEVYSHLARYEGWRYLSL